METYPTILEQNRRTIIFALSDTEIGKIHFPNKNVAVDVTTGEPVKLFDLPTIEDEINCLKYANRWNDLMPQFIREQ